MFQITFGILTISDSCSKKEKSDKSGPALENLVTDESTKTGAILKGLIQCRDIVPDDEFVIMETLVRWCDKIGVNVILTTGGTGFSRRDVTPEATRKVIEKEAPGIAYTMLSESLKLAPMAILSRAICGIRGKTLIINLPGSPKAVEECLGTIAYVIPHAVDLLLNENRNPRAVDLVFNESTSIEDLPVIESKSSQSDPHQNSQQHHDHQQHFLNHQHLQHLREHLMLHKNIHDQNLAQHSGHTASNSSQQTYTHGQSLSTTTVQGHVHTHSTTPHIFGEPIMSLDDIPGRLRESPFPMISLEESQKILEKTSKKNNLSTKVDIWNSFGRVLSETVYSPCDLPPFRASIKDGYAVIAKDGKGKRTVLGGLEAGHKPGIIKLVPGVCVRINTGAPVPDEATAVIQVEDTKLLEKSVDGKEEKVIEILVEPKEGQDIRPIGSDVKKGTAVLKAGTKIGAIEMGLLASCGCSQIPVTWLPKIGVLSTGNELQTAGELPKPGHVYDSNKITLIMMLKENGYDSVDLGIATDDEATMIAAIKKALKKVDLIITTGSVSMGDRDMLKPILKDVFKATIHFGRVNLKPGKPTTYATCEYEGQTKYFLCLPGNPVSAMVTANLFVFPLLNLLTGNKAKPVIVKAKTTSRYLLDPRPEFARVILVWSPHEAYPEAHSTGNQISSKLLSCKNANALLMLPGKTTEHQQILEPGSVISAMLLNFNQHNG